MTYHSLEVGYGTLTALCDGKAHLGAEMFPNLPPAKAARLLAQAGLGDGPVEICVNAFLYRTAQRTVLIDAGGAGLEPQLGGLAALLDDMGVGAGDIDTVFCTHLHPDHVGGLVQDGAPVFAAAELMVHADELAFWGNAEIRVNVPPEAKGAFDAANAAIDAYRDRLRPFSGTREVAPGAVSVELPGHTPGHTGLQIGTEDDGVLVWGDIVHVAAFQLPEPTATIVFDVSPEAAIATRQSVLERVARSGMRVAGGHLSTPGFGRIRAQAEGYAFEPENQKSCR